MASLKNLLLFPQRNLADPLQPQLAQPPPILSLSKANYISCKSQPVNSAPDDHRVNLDITSMCHAIDKHSTTETMISFSPLSEALSTVPAIVQKAPSFEASRSPSHVKQVSKEDNSSLSNSLFVTKETKRQKILHRKTQKITPKAMVVKKAQPKHNPKDNTRQEENPHALPMDYEFQTELALLRSDAAKANWKLTDYISDNRSKYPRVTKYLWCLADDFIF